MISIIRIFFGFTFFMFLANASISANATKDESDIKIYEYCFDYFELRQILETPSTFVRLIHEFEIGLMQEILQEETKTLTNIDSFFVQKILYFDESMKNFYQNILMFNTAKNIKALLLVAEEFTKLNNFWGLEQVIYALENYKRFFGEQPEPMQSELKKITVYRNLVRLEKDDNFNMKNLPTRLPTLQRVLRRASKQIDNSHFDNYGIVIDKKADRIFMKDFSIVNQYADFYEKEIGFKCTIENLKKKHVDEVLFPMMMALFGCKVSDSVNKEKLPEIIVSEQNPSTESAKRKNASDRTSTISGSEQHDANSIVISNQETKDNSSHDELKSSAKIKRPSHKKKEPKNRKNSAVFNSGKLTKSGDKIVQICETNLELKLPINTISDSTTYNDASPRAVQVANLTGEKPKGLFKRTRTISGPERRNDESSEDAELKSPKRGKKKLTKRKHSAINVSELTKSGDKIVQIFEPSPDDTANVDASLHTEIAKPNEKNIGEKPKGLSRRTRTISGPERHNKSSEDVELKSPKRSKKKLTKRKHSAINVSELTTSGDKIVQIFEPEPPTNTISDSTTYVDSSAAKVQINLKLGEDTFDKPKKLEPRKSQYNKKRPNDSTVIIIENSSAFTWDNYPKSLETIPEADCIKFRDLEFLKDVEFLENGVNEYGGIQYKWHEYPKSSKIILKNDLNIFQNLDNMDDETIIFSDQQ